MAEASLGSPQILQLVHPHAASLCDACLGRLVARVEPGLGNAERGRRLRASGDHAAPSTCGLCEGLVGRIPAWADLCVAAARDVEHDTFLVGCVVFDEVRAREQRIFEDLIGRAPELAGTPPPKSNVPPWTLGEWLKTEINREVGRLIEAQTGKKVRFDRPDVTFRIDTRFDHVALEIADLYAKGRYRKLVRDLPQTRWPCRACGGIGCRQCGHSGKTYESSVEELVAAPFVEATRASGEAFHGMGREDIDARTLGDGRPFVLELKRPRVRSLDHAALAHAINQAAAGRVEVQDLDAAGPDDAARFKAADPDKTYHALCDVEGVLDRARLEAALQELAGVELDQRTPQRVSHRRADLVRQRRVIGLRLLSWAPPSFSIEIKAESGTYIKEFVSGDEGRTRPSLSERVGVQCRVRELDVVAVHWSENATPDGPNP